MLHSQVCLRPSLIIITGLKVEVLGTSTMEKYEFYHTYESNINPFVFLSMQEPYNLCTLKCANSWPRQYNEAIYTCEGLFSGLKRIQSSGEQMPYFCIPRYWCFEVTGLQTSKTIRLHLVELSSFTGWRFEIQTCIESTHNMNYLVGHTSLAP